MLAEIFLLIITLCAAIVRQEERFPALVYCAVSWLFYFVGYSLETESQVYQIAAVSEVVLIFLLTCIHGCINSKLTTYLIPISLASILMHFYGWTMFMNHRPEINYNNIVLVYWIIIIGLFLSVGRWSGSTIWHTRFLGSTDDREFTVGKVFK